MAQAIFISPSDMAGALDGDIVLVQPNVQVIIIIIIIIVVVVVVVVVVLKQKIPNTKRLKIIEFCRPMEVVVVLELCEVELFVVI